jgi:hypothetical protein
MFINSRLRRELHIIFAKKSIKGILYAPLVLAAAYVLIIAYKNPSGDFIYYSKSGDEIFNRINIYETGARWGTFSAVVSHLLFSFLPSTFVNLFLTLATPIGGILISKHLGAKISNACLIGLVIMISGPGRESVQNGQVTGLIILLFGIVLSLPESRAKTIIGTLMILYCVELKPHVSLPLLLFFYRDLKNCIKYLPVAALILHSLINIYVGEVLEIDFIERLINLSSQDPSNPWPDINNLLPLVDIFLNQATIVKAFGLVIYAFLLLKVLTSKHKLQFLVMSVLFSPYIHTYDLLGILVIVLAAVILNSKAHVTSVYFIALCLIPNMLNSPTLLALSCILSLSIILLYTSSFSFSLHYFKITIVVSSIVLFFVATSSSNELIARSGIVVTVCLGLIGLIERSSAVKQKRQSIRE